MAKTINVNNKTPLDINISTGEAPVPNFNVSKKARVTGLDATLGAISIASQAANNFMQSSQLNDTDSYYDTYNNFSNQTYYGDFNSIINQRRQAYLEDAPTWEDIRALSSGDLAMSTLNGVLSGAGAGSSLGPIGAGVGAAIGGIASLAGGLSAKKKAKEKAEQLAALRESALRMNERNYLVGLENAQSQIDSQALANLAAFGGPLQTNGSDWSNGIISVEAGGTHEKNPIGGVPMGIGENGKPNLVEEGEVIYNDYVFTNRFKVPFKLRKKHKLGKDITFAEAVTKIQKESEERPNDPISKRGLDSALEEFMIEQEKIRERKNRKANKFAYGGKFGNIFKGEGEEENVLKPRSTWMTYAPIIGQGIATLTDAFGLTNKPDYSNSDALIKDVNRVMNPSKIAYNPTGTYLQYKPMDTLFYANQLAAQSNATKRAIRETANGNRLAAMTGLIGANYATQTQLGNLYRQAEEYNQAQKEKVTAFNNSINRANAEGFFKAAVANQEAQQKANALGLEALLRARQKREATKLMADENKVNNISGFLTSLGELGHSNAALNARDFLIGSETFGPIDQSLLPLLAGQSLFNRTKRSRTRKSRSVKDEKE